MKKQTENHEETTTLSAVLDGIAYRRDAALDGRGRVLKASAENKADARRERQLHRELKARRERINALDTAYLGMVETNPKTGRSYSLPKVLADAVLRPRGERSRDVDAFQASRARQTLTEEEREELEAAIRAELHIQRARTAAGADLRRRVGSRRGCYNLGRGGADCGELWATQYRIGRKSQEIAAACRAGRAVLSYGMHGDKADSRTFHFVTLPESLRHVDKDRAPQWWEIQKSIFSKLAAHYAPRRGGRAHFRKDCQLFRRTVELIVSGRPAAGQADLTPEGLAERLEKTLEALYKNGQRMRERLADGAAKLAAKRQKQAARIPAAPRAVVALEDLSLPGEGWTPTPYARAVLAGDRATSRRFGRWSWPLAPDYFPAHREELIALVEFMNGHRA